MASYMFAPSLANDFVLDRVLDLVSGARNAGREGPAYDVEKLDDVNFRLSLLVPGFSEQDLGIEMREGVLTVTGKLPAVDGQRRFVYKGIVVRDFTRSFRLADHVHVTGARLKDGVLDIELHRELPESLKPRVIPINGEGEQRPPAIEGEVSETQVA